MHCDVRKRNPLEPLELAAFGLVTFGFCIEQAPADFKTYKQAMANVCSTERPGGYLLLLGAMSESRSYLGNKSYKTFFQDEAQVRDALNYAGINVLKMETHDAIPSEFTDTQGTYILKGHNCVGLYFCHLLRYVRK